MVERAGSRARNNGFSRSGTQTQAPMGGIRDTHDGLVGRASSLQICAARACARCKRLFGRVYPGWRALWTSEGRKVVSGRYAASGGSDASSRARHQRPEPGACDFQQGVPIRADCPVRAHRDPISFVHHFPHTAAGGVIVLVVCPPREEVEATPAVMCQCTAKIASFRELACSQESDKQK